MQHGSATQVSVTPRPLPPLPGLLLRQALIYMEYKVQLPGHGLAVQGYKYGNPSGGNEARPYSDGENLWRELMLISTKKKKKLCLQRRR